jgi:hypothetical protein
MSQAAISISGKATGRSTRHNTEANLLRTEKRITLALLPDESRERFCLGFLCMSNAFRSLHVTMQTTHDIAMAIQALSPQRKNGRDRGGMAPNHPVDGSIVMAAKAASAWIDSSSGVLY